MTAFPTDANGWPKALEDMSLAELHIAKDCYKQWYNTLRNSWEHQVTKIEYYQKIQQCSHLIEMKTIN